MVKTDSPKLLNNVLLGVAQILLWGGSFFLLAIMANPIIQETGWSHQVVYGSLSLALLVSGLLAPTIGKQIQKQDKNKFILYSGLVIATGLLVIALSYSIYLFGLGWIIIGVGMAMGLYDALFACMGKKYGPTATKAITQITLISGFCTSIVWPALSILLEYCGWRTTCMLYAALLIIAVYPIHRFTLYTSGSSQGTKTPKKEVKGYAANPISPQVYYLLVISFTIGSVLMTAVSLHLIDILLSHQLPKAVAISLGALLGPSQVGVRLLEVLLPEKAPIKTAVMASIGVLLGLSLLLLSPAIAFLGIIIYGLGNGMRSILRGTLPLSLFGSHSYASLMGALARPPLIAQAFTPFAGALLIQNLGINGFLSVLCFLAVLNVILTIGIQHLLLHRPKTNRFNPAK